MADSKVSALTTIPAVDRTADVLYIVDTSGGTSNKVTPNTLLGFSGGAPVSTTDTQTVQNKTLDNTTTITVKDNVFTLQDNSDTTKQAQFQLSGITTGNTRTFTLPDASTTLVGTDATQTLTNKTINSLVSDQATLTRPTITVDSIAEYTAANGVSVDGLNIKDGKLNTNNSVVTANVTDSAITPAKLQSGTGTGWAWQSWTPTWTNLTIGNGTTNARYIQTGKTVFYRLIVTFGSTTTMGTNPIFTLPVSASTNNNTVTNIGTGILSDTGTGNFECAVWYVSTTTARPVVKQAGSTYVQHTQITSAVPHTWAVDDIITLHGFYEAA